MIKQFKLCNKYAINMYIDSGAYTSNRKIIVCCSSNYFQSIWVIKTIGRYNTLNMWRKEKK